MRVKNGKVSELVVAAASETVQLVSLPLHNHLPSPVTLQVTLFDELSAIADRGEEVVTTLWRFEQLHWKG